MSLLFDPLRPDEPARSALARIIRDFPSFTRSAINQMVLGSYTRNLSFDFPQNAPAIMALWGFVGDVHQFAEKHTMLPWLSRFAAKPLLEAADDHLRSTTCRQDGYLGLLTQLGISKDTPLNACARCAIRDTNDFGSPHYRLWHQLPGITECAECHTPLTAVSVTRGNPDYVALNASLIESGKPAGPVSALQRCVVEQVKHLLQTKQRGPGWSAIQKQLLARLADCGVEPFHHIGMPELRRRLFASYGSEAARHALTFSGRGERGWMWHLFTDSKVPLGPVHAAIVCAVMNWDLSDLVAQAHSAGADLPPWPCMSPTSGCRGHRTIQAYERTRDGQNAILTCPFCKTSYMRPLPLCRDGTGVFPFSITCDPLALERNFLSSWNNADSWLELSEQFGRPINSLKIWAKRLGLPSHPRDRIDGGLTIQVEMTIRERGTTSFQTLLKQNRAKWLKYVKQGYGFSRKFPLYIREARAWLLIFDRHWYAQATPWNHKSIRRRPLGRNIRDLDAKIAPKVPSLSPDVEKLKADTNRRITVRMILRHVGEKLYNKRLHTEKMPLTRAALVQLAETRDEHAKRWIATCPAPRPNETFRSWVRRVKLDSLLHSAATKQSVIDAFTNQSRRPCRAYVCGADSSLAAIVPNLVGRVRDLKQQHQHRISMQVLLDCLAAHVRKKVIHVERMPQTRAALASLVESREEFAERRISTCRAPAPSESLHDWVRAMHLDTFLYKATTRNLVIDAFTRCSGRVTRSSRQAA